MTETIKKMSAATRALFILFFNQYFIQAKISNHIECINISTMILTTADGSLLKCIYRYNDAQRPLFASGFKTQPKKISANICILKI